MPLREQEGGLEDDPQARRPAGRFERLPSAGRVQVNELPDAQSFYVKDWAFLVRPPPKAD